MRTILERELLSLFRSRRAFAIQLAVALVCTLLIALRWPEGAQVDLAGSRAREVFVLFGYTLLTALVLMVPAFPASSIVRERQQRTLVLLIHSPLSAPTIYFGKLMATLGFVLVLVALSIPGAAACHAMGGIAQPRAAKISDSYVILLRALKNRIEKIRYRIMLARCNVKGEFQGL